MTVNTIIHMVSAPVADELPLNVSWSSPVPIWALKRSCNRVTKAERRSKPSSATWWRHKQSTSVSVITQAQFHRNPSTGNVHSLLCRHHQQKATFIMYKWQRIMGKSICVCLWASAVPVWLDVWASADLLDTELATPPAWATVWRCVWNCTTSEGTVLHAQIPHYWPLPLQPSLSWGEWVAQWVCSESSPADTIMTTH